MFRIMIAIAIVISTMCLLVSCNSEEQINSNGSSNDANKRGLLIYTLQGGDKALSSAISSFSQKHKGVAVDFKIFSDVEEYKKALTTELMVGKGPDVIYSRSWYEISSIYKLMSSGAFTDLNKLISEDDTFRLDDYYENIFDSGVFKGKRFFFPITFHPPAFMYCNGVPQKNGINMAKWSLEDFVESAQNFAKGNKVAEKYFCYTIIDFMLLYESLNYVDYDKGQATLDSGEFVDILNNYKEISNSSCKYDVLIKQKNAFFDMLGNGSLMFYNNEDLSISLIHKMDSILKANYKQRLNISPYPTYKGDGKLKAFVDSFIAINNNSSNIKLSFELAKSVLSKENQSLDTEANFPVNKRAYEALIKKYSVKDIEGQYSTFSCNLYGSNIDIGFTTQSMSSDLVSNIDNILTQIEGGMVIDNTILKFISDVLRAFLDGTKSAEQTAKELNEKVNLYLNE